MGHPAAPHRPSAPEPPLPPPKPPATTHRSPHPHPSSQPPLRPLFVLISSTYRLLFPHRNARLPLDLEHGHRHPTHSAIPASLVFTDTNARTDVVACIASTTHPGIDQPAPRHQPLTTRHYLHLGVPRDCPEPAERGGIHQHPTVPFAPVLPQSPHKPPAPTHRSPPPPPQLPAPTLTNQSYSFHQRIHRHRRHIPTRAYPSTSNLATGTPPPPPLPTAFPALQSTPAAHTLAALPSLPPPTSGHSPTTFQRPRRTCPEPPPACPGPDQGN